MLILLSRILGMSSLNPILIQYILPNIFKVIMEPVGLMYLMAELEKDSIFNLG